MRKLLAAIVSWAATGALFVLALGPRILYLWGAITAVVAVAATVAVLYERRRYERRP